MDIWGILMMVIIFSKVSFVLIPVMGLFSHEIFHAEDGGGRCFEPSSLMTMGGKEDTVLGGAGGGC